MSLLLALLLACGASVPGVPAASVLDPAPVARPGLAFVEHLVGTSDGRRPLPTVVVVHGMGDRADRILHLLDDLPGPARVLAPQAPRPWGDGGSWFSVQVRDADPVALGEELLQVADDVVAWLDGLGPDHAVHGRPVITGFSQGGMVSFAVAVRHPEAFAGAVPIAGWLPPVLVPTAPSEAQRALRIRAFHGTADERLPFVQTRRVVDALRAAGFDVELTPAPGVGHTIPPLLRSQVVEAVGALLTAP